MQTLSLGMISDPKLHGSEVICLHKNTYAQSSHAWSKLFTHLSFFWGGAWVWGCPNI